MIKLLVLDVDGCLTDGKIIYSSDGSETKAFNVKDGLAIASWIKLGNYVAIITGRKSSVVQKRADELGIKELHQGVKNKAQKLREILQKLDLQLSEVAAIGDDLNDYKMLAMIEKSFTPKDGVSDIKNIAQRVLSKCGGDGAVREMIDILIEENGQKEQFLNIWIEE